MLMLVDIHIHIHTCKRSRKFSSEKCRFECVEKASEKNLASVRGESLRIFKELIELRQYSRSDPAADREYWDQAFRIQIWL